MTPFQKQALIILDILDDLTLPESFIIQGVRISHGVVVEGVVRPIHKDHLMPIAIEIYRGLNNGER